MRRVAAIVLLACMCAGAAAPRYALLVGSNEGGPGLDKLRYAERDARRFAGLLTSLGGFDAANVKIVLKPDSAGLEQSLRETASLIGGSGPEKPGGLFLLYYSGHADAQRLLLGESRGYCLRRINAFLDSVPATIKLAVFDACQSGAVTALKGGQRGQPFYFENQDTIRGQVIIASSSAHEKAQESEALQGSVFSHHWFNALRGSADISGDKRVTVNEAYQYAYRKTLETTALTNAGMQHPVYRFNIRGQGDIVLTDLSRKRGGVLLSDDAEGKFLITGEDYASVFADFYKRPGRELYISLGEGRYTAICAAGDDVMIHSFSLSPEATYRLGQSMLRPVAAPTSRLKGNPPEPVPGVGASRPLSTHTFGVGIGAFLLATGPHPDRTLSATVTNRFYLTERTELSLDIRGFFPGYNAGVEAGFDHALSPGPVTPIAGASAGVYFLQESGPTPLQSWGPAITLRWGLAADISSRMQLLIGVPYTLVLGSKINHVLGLEARLLFRGHYRNVRVLNP